MHHELRMPLENGKKLIQEVFDLKCSHNWNK